MFSYILLQCGYLTKDAIDVNILKMCPFIFCIDFKNFWNTLFSNSWAPVITNEKKFSKRNFLKDISSNSLEHFQGARNHISTNKRHPCANHINVKEHDFRRKKLLKLIFVRRTSSAIQNVEKLFTYYCTLQHRPRKSC